jgi:hypothetical protein
MRHPRRPPPGHKDESRFAPFGNPLRFNSISTRSSFRLIVSGKIGVKEIERLIQKLEIDKEILADQEDDANEEAAN